MDGVYLLWMMLIVKFLMEGVYLNYSKVLLESEFFTDSRLFSWNIQIEKRPERVLLSREAPGIEEHLWL